jgi:hypothetical protein
LPKIDLGVFMMSSNSMVLTFLVFFLEFFLTFANAASAAPLSCSNLAKQNNFVAKAHEFMQKNDLIRDGEEIKLPNLNYEWTLFKIVPLKMKECLVVMALGGGGDAYEVLSVVLGSNRGYKFALYETLHKIPREAVIQFGKTKEAQKGPGSFSSGKSYYVARVYNDNGTGDVSKVPSWNQSVLSAFKALDAQLFNTRGFNGIIERIGQASFDPTNLGEGQKRDWQVTRATFNLRSENTAETLNISAKEFDQKGADAYWNGCARDPQYNRPHCMVGPVSAQGGVVQAILSTKE